MKLIYGLDLGTASVGWAVVRESTEYTEPAQIIAAGVRSYPITTDESGSFLQGKSITTNADRRLKHSARLNNHRFKLRRHALVNLFKEHGWINDATNLCEDGAGSTYETLRLRAQAATDRVELTELARVLLLLNKKRGYKSSRKNAADESLGEAVTGIEVAKELQRRCITPGQYCCELYEKGMKKVPDFYRSDLQAELDLILTQQRKFKDSLPEDVNVQLRGKNESQSLSLMAKFLDVKGLRRASSRSLQQKIEEAKWRVEALEAELDNEQLVVVIGRLNGQIARASGYLGAISDRSKELMISGQTIGQYKWSVLQKNPNFSFRDMVFYRQDYMDEFDRIWKTQQQFHSELTDELCDEIRNNIVFYQRPLKSQKSSVAICELEGYDKCLEIDGKRVLKRIGPRVAPKSSPAFQEFRCLQTLNNLKIDDIMLSDSERCLLLSELNYVSKLTDKQIVKLICPKRKHAQVNFAEVHGNTTMASILSASVRVLDEAGYLSDSLNDLPASKKAVYVSRLLDQLGINSDILRFKSELSGAEFENQASYRLWHLLYSWEGDDSRSGNEKLIQKLADVFGMSEDAARVFCNIRLEPDYGSLSVKAIKNIMPYLKEGQKYSEACHSAGYNHSARSLTREERDSKVYVDRLEVLPKNSLRNPVVEKILNQLIHVVNTLVERYGKPDEIRIELARELKKSAKERKSLSDAMALRSKDNDRIAQMLKQPPFNINRPSRKDIIRYRLYEELSDNGFKTLYSDTYIPREELFGKNFNIEHIIPQASLFDDSFANKTIELTSVNILKGNTTAMDFVRATYGERQAETYKEKVKSLMLKGKISKQKYKNLICGKEDIHNDFLNRELRDTQYISRKACELLETMVPHVVATTGAVTDKLREDWQLVDLMKELNWKKYDKQGMTRIDRDRDGRLVGRIEGWTKRNDNRHHAMDAITIAFSRKEFVQYLNNLSARSDKSGSIYGIERKHLYRDANGARRFNPPMPLNQFRTEARRVLEGVLVSFKAKNKVVTRARNTTKSKEGLNSRIQLTPRGALHNETIYGQSRYYVTSEIKVGAKLTPEVIANISSRVIRNVLTDRLEEHDGDPKKAFTGKNSLQKNPIYLDTLHTVKVPDKIKIVTLEPRYTVRKKLSGDLKIDKVIDKGIKRVLEQRIAEYGGDQKKAFADLESNPVYLNKQKGIVVKRVRISAVNVAVPLHARRDKFGDVMRDASGMTIPNDFVQTSGNHHVCLFETPEGKIEEVVVSFFEATARAIAQPPLPVIDRNYRAQDGWRLFMTLKRNEYVVFPRYEEASDGSGEMLKTFDPHDLDLTNPDNYHLISPNLYRVQKLASKVYYFRHHLETNVDEITALRDITWKRILRTELMRDAVKVRLDHTGRICHVGE